MQLFFGGTSPYVRKVTVAAAECGLTDRIERVETFPWDADTRYADINPVGKVPALVTDDGQVLYDSRVIFEYLDSLHDGQKLIPPSGAERFEQLRIAALAEGMMDAVILLFSEVTRRPKELHWPYWDDRQRGKVATALATLDDDALAFDPARADVAQITTACACGWIAFRREILGIDFRDGHPALSAWFDAFSQRPSMQASLPKAQ